MADTTPEKANVCIVAGPPCAGKSTYVEERAQPGDLVWDYDRVHQALTPAKTHQHNPAIRDYVMAAYEAIIGVLKTHADQRAWVITATKRAEELHQIQRSLKADVVLLIPDRLEAQNRAALGRPPEWRGYIDRWYDETDIRAADFAGIKGRGNPKEKKMGQKVFHGGLELKDEKTGEFEAAFATLNVIDHDGDVTLPGAFTAGQEVPISHYGHDHHRLPVGSGVIQERKDKAIILGRFFLNTTMGREHYETVKGLGKLQQWSYAFDVVQQETGEFEGKQVRFLKKLDVAEVAPVMRGAGIDTETVAIKSTDGMKPYPNEHACRLEDPGKYDTCRRGKRTADKPDSVAGKEYAVIYCKKGDGPMEQQAFRYPKDTWTATQAGAHCEYNHGSFEAAKADTEGEAADHRKPSGEVERLKARIDTRMREV